MDPVIGRWRWLRGARVAAAAVCFSAVCGRCRVACPCALWDMMIARVAMARATQILLTSCPRGTICDMTVATDPCSGTVYSSCAPIVCAAAFCGGQSRKCSVTIVVAFARCAARLGLCSCCGLWPPPPPPTRARAVTGLTGARLALASAALGGSLHSVCDDCDVGTAACYSRWSDARLAETVSPVSGVEAIPARRTRASQRGRPRRRCHIPRAWRTAVMHVFSYVDDLLHAPNGGNCRGAPQ